MRLRTSLCLFLCLLSTVAVAQDDPVTIGGRFSLDSTVLGEERSYWVHLPGSYEQGTQSYPVLYLLDGDAYFHSASGVVQFMSATQIPEMIVVAIPNTNRTRDLTPTHTKLGFDGKETEFLAPSGGGDAFLRFLREELFMKIESTYRTAPYRVLVGHSFGGLIAVHAFLNVPDMFQAYIAIDPSLWWDGEKLVDAAKDRIDASADIHRSIYISLANNPAPEPGTAKRMELAGRRFGMILESSASPNLRSELQYFDDEDHGSVPLISLYRGLLFTFEGFKPPPSMLMENPIAIRNHFQNVSDRLGLIILPPESLVNDWGYFLLGKEDVEGAIELFRLNVENYPQSSNVYDSLGEAYMVNGDTTRSIESYQKSLELDPENTNATAKLEELRAPED